MSDTTSTGPTNTEHDSLEEREDAREEKQTNAELEDDGLLPLPDATPTDGPSPAA